MTIVSSKRPRCLRSLTRAALARSVSLASGADRDRVREALTAMGLPADARAETLAPEQWRDLYERLA